MFCAVFCAALVFAWTPLSAAKHAETTAYNWYCKRAEDHARPECDPNMAFIADCGGYYIGSAPDDKVIYLTFDAGYENGNVARVLDTLRDRQVPGAFFILDNLIIRNTELVRRMADEGHLVCNHTAKHRDMTKATVREDFTAELNALSTLYRETLGRDMAMYYRPPQGRFSEQNLRYASEAGYKTVLWSFAYADWDNDKQPDPARAKERILKYTHNGMVVLLHPTSATNAAILGELIDEWKNQGYRFGTLDELCGA